MYVILSSIKQSSELHVRSLIYSTTKAQSPHVINSLYQVNSLQVGKPGIFNKVTKYLKFHKMNFTNQILFQLDSLFTLNSLQINIKTFAKLSLGFRSRSTVLLYPRKACSVSYSCVLFRSIYPRRLLKKDRYVPQNCCPGRQGVSLGERCLVT